jgi:environmental stress-induced protein Ves
MLTALPRETYARSTWKNGLGWTDQIAIHPPGATLQAGDFAWRVSTAQIAQGSPFSPFPAHDRLLVILDGEGVRLSHEYEPPESGEPPEVVELGPGEPYEFPGDIPTRCTLRGGPVRDLSVFFRKGEWQVEAECLDLREDYAWEPRAQTELLVVFEGQVRAGGQIAADGGSLRLQAHDAAPLTLETTGALVVLIRIQPLS